jgi:hypothetical protein
MTSLTPAGKSSTKETGAGDTVIENSDSATANPSQIRITSPRTAAEKIDSEKAVRIIKPYIVK